MRTEFRYHDAISAFVNNTCEMKDGLVCIDSKQGAFLVFHSSAGRAMPYYLLTKYPPTAAVEKLRCLYHKNFNVTLLSSYLESFFSEIQGILCSKPLLALDAVTIAKVCFVLVHKIHHRIKTASENGILLIQLFLHKGFLLATAISNFSSLSSCPA